MAEAIFACEEVEKLPAKNAAGAIALSLAKLSGFAKYLLVRDRPGHTSDCNAEYQKPGDLQAESHRCRLDAVGSGIVTSGKVAVLNDSPPWPCTQFARFVGAATLCTL